MKKVLLIAVLLISPLFGLMTYAEQQPQGVEASITVRGHTLSINDEIWNDKKYVVYGTPEDVKAIEGRDDFSQGEYRYLGYTAMGGLFTNQYFPDDAPSSTAPWNKNWISKPWKSDTAKQVHEITRPEYPYEEPNPNDPFYYPMYQQAVALLNNLMGDDPATRINPRKAAVYDKWYGKVHPDGTVWSGETLIDKIIIQSPPVDAWTSPLLRYLPGSASGVHISKSNNLPYYETFGIPPVPPELPNLSIKITKTGFSLLDPIEPEKNQFQAEAVATVLDDIGWPETHDPIKVYFWYIRNGEVVWGPESDLTISKKGETQTFNLSWKSDFGDDIYLRASVNPPVPDNPGDEPDGPRQIEESTYDDNYSEIPLQMPEKSAGPENMYASFDYTYTPVPKPIKINDAANSGKDEHRIFTYKPNKISMETSVYTKKVEIIFNKDFKVVLNSDKSIQQYKKDKTGKYVAMSSFYNMSLDIDKVLVNPYKDTKTPPPGYTKTREDKLAWTFVFSLKNYSVYPYPIPNDTQQDTLVFTAYDQNGEKTKYDFEETNPLGYKVNVRQTKLFNLRISDVKDIFWQYVFNYSTGDKKTYKSLRENDTTAPPFGPTKLPITTNAQSSNRLISKGYAVQFKIDSEGLSQSSDALMIKPTFWWYDRTAKNFKEVDLYFDVTNQNLYNVPIELDPNASESNYNTKVLKYLKDSGMSQTAINQLKQKYSKNFMPNYSKFTVNPASVMFDQKILMSGRSGWEFKTGNNEITNPDADQDNYYTRFEKYRNTWTFTYSLHPKTKAFLKGTNYNPFTSKPLTGALLVNFKIMSVNAVDPGTTLYHYSKYEDTWYKDSAFNSVVVDEGTSDEVTAKGNVFYYNLDWSALDDYSTQQNW